MVARGRVPASLPEAQRRVLDQAINTLRASTDEFAHTVKRMAADTSLPPATQLIAATRGLEMVFRADRAAQQADLEQRMGEVEERVHQIMVRLQQEAP